MRLIKIVVVLLVLAFAGLAGYAYFGDMAPKPQEMRQPVALDLGATPEHAQPVQTPSTQTPDNADPQPENTPDDATLD